MIRLRHEVYDHVYEAARCRVEDLHASDFGDDSAYLNVSRRVWGPVANRVIDLVGDRAFNRALEIINE